MPHSVSPPSSPPPRDIALPDAPAEPSSSLPIPHGANATGSTDDASASEDSQSQTAAGTQDGPKANLEAMFDEDEDDEFTSSSSAVDTSSAPQAPL